MSGLLQKFLEAFFRRFLIKLLTYKSREKTTKQKSGKDESLQLCLQYVKDLTGSKCRDYVALLHFLHKIASLF